MLVCHCEAVKDATIRRAVRDGACTRRQVARSCGAGRQCGGCVPVIDEILADEGERPLHVVRLPDVVAAG